MGNRVGDWTDVVDLDYGNRELWDYQIETLKYWAEKYSKIAAANKKLQDAKKAK